MNFSTLVKQKNARGSALMTALFIVTIVAITVTAMSVHLQMDIYRTQLSRDHQAYYLNAQSLESYSAALLKRDTLVNLPFEFSAAAIGLTTINGKAKIDDAQAKYNLNNLANADEIPTFARLILLLEPSISEPSALAIAEHLHQRAIQPHFAFALPSELLDISIIPKPLAIALAKHVIALPDETLININTASVTVLQTLGRGLTTQQARLIIKARNQQKQFKSLDAFFQQPELANLKIPETQITVRSHYFLSTVKINKNQGTFQLMSLYKRSIVDEHPIIISKLWHSIN